MTVEMLTAAAKIGGVKNIAIVDDAYDPPKPEEIKEDSFNKFALAVFNSEELATELWNSAALEKGDIDDFEEFLEKETLITKLWNAHVGTAPTAGVSADGQRALGDLFDDIKVDRLSKLTQLKPLETILEQIEGKLIRLGSMTDPEDIANADVVFLDLYLSEDVPPEVRPGAPVPKSAYEKARDRALQYVKSVRTIKDGNVSSIAPAFVLISSQGTDQKAENFRRSTGQMKSRFRFVSKQAIADFQPHELLAIADIFRTCGACAVVEPILRALPGISAKAILWVTDQLSDLDISDFGHLYNLKLQKEGQPLADYVKELVAAAVAERVCCLYSELNLPNPTESPFKDILNFFQFPSNGFAELYSAARISADRGYRGRSKYDPQSGDIFLLKEPAKKKGASKERKSSITGRRAFSVMSPPCDLIDRDGSGPSAKSVLLLQGVVKPMTFKREHDDPQIISYGRRFYEILWDKKQPLTMETDSLQKRWKANRLTWIGRLKAEYFIALQNSFLADLGRVGLIKPPAVYEPLNGIIFFAIKKDLDYKLGEPFTASENYAFLFSGQKKEIDKQDVIFSGDFITYFVKTLEKAAGIIDLPDPVKEKINGLLERKAQLVHFIEKKSSNSHSIENYLRVELHQGPPPPTTEKKTDIVTLCLWPE